jgi:hypothetical protein
VPSKLEQFLTENKLDRRRIVASSHAIEDLRPEDRAARLAKRQSKDAPAKPAEGDAKPAKRRSGRPVTERLLNDALAGKAITGPAKTRLLRAVNRILEQKKQKAVDLKALF